MPIAVLLYRSTCSAVRLFRIRMRVDVVVAAVPRIRRIVGHPFAHEERIVLVQLEVFVELKKGPCGRECITGPGILPRRAGIESHIPKTWFRYPVMWKRDCHELS